MTFNEFLKKHDYRLDGTPIIDKEKKIIPVKLIKDKHVELLVTLTPDYKLIDCLAETGHNFSFELMKDISSVQCWEQINRPTTKWDEFALKHGYKLSNYGLYFVEFSKWVELKDYDPKAEFNESRRKLDVYAKSSNCIEIYLTLTTTGEIQYIKKTHTKHNQETYRSEFGQFHFPTPLTKEEMEDLSK